MQWSLTVWPQVVRAFIDNIEDEFQRNNPSGLKTILEFCPDLKELQVNPWLAKASLIAWYGRASHAWSRLIRYASSTDGMSRGTLTL